MASLSNRVISIYNRKTSMRLAPAEWEASADASSPIFEAIKGII